MALPVDPAKGKLSDDKKRIHGSYKLSKPIVVGSTFGVAIIDMRV